MKKMLSILMVVLLICLCGCGGKKEEERVISSFDTSRYYKDSSSLDFTPWRPPHPGDNICYDAPSLPDGTASIDHFISWCKVSVNDYEMDELYPDNRMFLSYIRECPRLVIPYMHYKEFKPQRACVFAQTTDYYIWYMTEDYKRFRFWMIPMSGLQAYHGLTTYFHSNKFNEEVDSGKCKYGKYYVSSYIDSVTEKQEMVVYFEVDGILVKLFLENMEWSPELFDYFDFQTVSLKD